MALVESDANKLRVPLYHQVYLHMRERILSGTLAPGERVPAEGDLAQEFGVSRITISRALGDLATEGLIQRSRGSGTRVSASVAVRAEPMVSSVEQLVEQLHRMGTETSIELISCDMIPAPFWVAKALSLPEMAKVQCATRVRNLDVGPFSHLTTFVPERIGSTFSRHDLAESSLIELLERAGVAIGRAEQTIGATIADISVAPLLGISAGSPLMRVTRTVYDVNDLPVEYLIALYNPDRFQYRVELERVGSGEKAEWHAL